MLAKKRTNSRRLANTLAIALLFGLLFMPSWSAAAGLENTAPAEETAGLQAAPEIPADVPEETPAEILEEIPEEIPPEIPTEAPAEELPEEAPVEETPAEEIPAETPADETPAGFPENLSIQAAPTTDVWVNIYRNVSGAAPAYTQVLTLAELASLTSIDASSFYLAAGISAAWTLDTAQPGAAQSQSVSVASIAGNAVNFYFNAPGGSWTGVESVANPVNPQVTGQSVVVYTYAALKAALQNAAYSYIEFGANLAYANTATSTAANTEATITIAPNRAAPELTLNAKGYEFRTNRTGNNVIRFAGTTTGSNLTQVVYQNWNVPEHRSAYGLFYGSSTRVVTLVFDGLTFAGPQLADLSTNSHLTLDGTRNPVDITITRPGNTGDAASEVVDAGNRLVLQGEVSVTRENVTGTTSLFTGFEFVTVTADADVFVEDRRASGLFASGSPAFVVERGASFTYRGNRQFTSSNLGSLTIGEDATFDLRASGNIMTPGLLRVGGPLTIGNNAAFTVVSENNAAAYPVVYTTGTNSHISITNPRSLLVYQSNASTSAGARAWNFATSSRDFLYAGTGLARWDTTLGAVPPANGNYSAPAKYWTNTDSSPLSITGRTSTGGNFSSSTFSNYVRVGDATVSTDFSLNGKIIADPDTAGVGRYTIEYLLQTPNEVGPPTETPMDLPAYQNYSWLGQSIQISFPPATGFRRVDDQPITASHVPGTRTIYAYYEPLNISVNPIELEKSAVRLGDNEWEVTLTINSDSETYTPAVDLDIMLTLDRSGSMSSARRTAVKNAATAMVNALATNEKLVGRIRMGVVSFATTVRMDLPLTDIRNAGAVSSSGVDAVKAAVGRVYDVIGSGSTYMDLGISSASTELYNSLRTSAYSSKHMVVLTDGEVTSTRVSATRAVATTYKGLGGRLVTVGLGVSATATNLLRELQNSGYYAATDGNVSQVFTDIADVIATAIQSGTVNDPVGAGFEFLSITGAVLNEGTVTNQVAASQGTVTLGTQEGVRTLVWNLDGQVPDDATLKYRVRLLNPNASKNTLLPTNGTTTLSYADIEGKPQQQNFVVPTVVYGVGTVTAAYDGAFPTSQRPASVVRGPVSLYPTAPAPFEFDGPQEAQEIGGYLLSSFTLTGSEIIDNQVVPWNLSAGTLADLIDQSNGRIVSLGANRYSLAVPAGDLTITYRYDRPANYDIVYHNVKGATNPNPETYNVLELPLELGGLTGRIGYTFNAWFKDALCTVPLTDDTIPTGTTGELHLWAKWGFGDGPETPDAYTIEYHNVNGATNPNPATYTVEDLPLELGGLTGRIGYTFNAWFTDDTYATSTTVVDALTESTDVVLHLWAKWGVGGGPDTPDTYTITYHNVNGATNPNPATYTILDTKDEGLALQGLTGRPGYTFNAWYTDDTYATTIATIPANTTGNLDLWAKWGDGGGPDTPDTYTITYHNVNGATNPNPATYTILDTKDGGLALRGLTGRPGYTFNAWYTDDTYATTIARIPANTTGNLDLWAKWGNGDGPDTPDTYTITYHNVNNVTNPNQATYTILDTKDEGLALQGLTGRPGYTFTGWYADSGYTIPVTGIEQDGLEDRDYWAKWGNGGPDNPNKPDIYTITYQNLNGATNPNPATYTIVDTPRILRALTRAGYAFEGWYADAAYTVPVTRIDNGGTGPRVFWAKWGNASAYEIVYHNVNGAANLNPGTYTLSDTAGTGLTLQGLTGRPGYTFTGWYADAAYTIPVTGIEPGGLEDRDFWAKWGTGGPDNPDKPDTYTITYHVLEMVYTETYTIIDTPHTLRPPVLQGDMAFGGWFTSSGYYSEEIKRLPEGTTGNLEFWALIAMP